MRLPDKPSADRYADLPPSEQYVVDVIGAETLKMVGRLAASVTIAPPANHKRHKKVDNGSGVLVRFRGSLYFLTAAHVLARFEDRIARRHPVTFQLGNAAVIDPLTSVAWRDDTRDLLALNLSEDLVRLVGSDVHNLIDDPDVPVPQPGSSVLLAGYPGHMRSINGRVIDYSGQAAMLRVTTSGEDYAVCQFEREHWVDFLGGGIPRKGRGWGGISGGPVLLLGKLHFPLVALITEFQRKWDLLRVQSIAPLLRGLAIKTA